MSKFLSEETAQFFTPTEEQLEKEQERYGNLFMRARQAQIKQLFRHMDLVDKFNNREQQNNQDRYGHLLDRYSAEQQNTNQIHSRYGHLLDRYIK